MKRAKVLLVLLYGQPIGELRETGSRRFEFEYDPLWQERGPDMPLSQQLHRGANVEAFLWGLLPESEAVLEALARDAGPKISPRNQFALLSVAGRECTGAVQFVMEEEVDSLDADGSIQWIDDVEVAEMLARVRRSLPPRSTADHRGRFSLAGVQPKLALYREGSLSGRWGVPVGSIPTTHILKPPIPKFEGQVENEHFCLALAREIGLRAASSQVVRFVDEQAIVVVRYDRLRRKGGFVLRVH